MYGGIWDCGGSLHNILLLFRLEKMPTTRATKSPKSTTLRLFCLVHTDCKQQIVRMVEADTTTYSFSLRSDMYVVLRLQYLLY